MSFDFIFKIAILGDTGVGKSSIVNKFARNTFNLTPGPTIGVEFDSKIIKNNGSKYKLQIWDMSGNKAYLNLIQMYLKNVAYVLLVYDISNKESFLNIKNWYNIIKKKIPHNAGIMIVCNKTDLYKKCTNTFSFVADEQLKHLSEELRIPYTKTTCNKTNSVDNLFRTLLDNIHKKGILPRTSYKKYTPITETRPTKRCSNCSIM